MFFPNPGTFDITITCQEATPPPNNLPCGAVNLPINGDECNYHFDDNRFATSSNAAAPAGIGNIPMPSCGNYQGADLWYTVQVPPSGLIGIQTDEGTICAGAFQLYTNPTNNCGTGTAFQLLADGCTMVGLTGPTSDPAMVYDAFANDLNIGDVVYIRYWERGGNENGPYEICAYEAQRPPNDAPCDAIALPLNTTCEAEQYIFENASFSGVPAPTCGGANFTANPGDVWFTFQVPLPFPPNYTGITVNTVANAPLDLAMAWYRINTEPCDPANPDLTQIACNASGTINSQAINPGLLEEGETIYVRIWKESPWIGSYDICAFLNQAPANDEPCGALPLALNYGCVMQTFTNSSATPSLVGVSTNAPCGGGIANNDVWFTVVVPPNGALQLDMLAGGLSNAGMAVYSGTCTNLNTPPIACANTGSQQGPGNANMPYLNLTGQAPGATLYVRVWRQAANTDGTFSICARRTDTPPGNCFYTLNMFDSGGDGWGGSYVTVCVAGNCIPYTVLGASASINIGVNIGQLFTVSYTAAGGAQGQNSFNVMQYGTPVYSSSSPPATGLVYSQTAECIPPPAPSGDCIGAVSICSDMTFTCQPYQPGGISYLNSSNQGCMSGEGMGVWMILNFGPNTVPCSPIAFDVVCGNIPVAQGGCGTSAPGTIFDFVVWGPYTNAGPGGDVNAGNICPPSAPFNQLPYRCNWASLSCPSTVKGLAYNNALPAYQYGGGGAMARHMVVNPGDRFMLLVNNWGNSGQQFNLVWKPVPPNFQVLASDCNPNSPWVDDPPVPAPPGTTADLDCYPLPVEFATFDAFARDKHVDVQWATASESGSAYFNVQRSADGEHFTTVGRVDALGFSYQMTQYVFVDDAPLNGLSYYRLEQVDQNGQTSNSRMVPVMFKGGRINMEVFPNPADETIWLSFDIDRESPLYWRISDASGRRVSEARINSTTGRNLFELPIARLDRGTYLIELVHEDGNQVGVSRFVKQ